MNNATTGDYLIQGGVGLHGLVIVTGSSLLLLTILCDKTLRKRKEMIIIAARAGADFIYGFATLLSTVYRVPLMIQGVHTDPYTVFKCIIVPSVPLIYIGLFLTTFMNFVVGVDRYIAVAYATIYRSLGVDYAKKVLLAVGVISLFVLATMFASILLFPGQVPQITRMCLTSPFPRWYASIFTVAIPFIGFLSVFVYIGIFFAYRSFQNHGQPISQLVEQQDVTQRRLTVTLGIIAASTLFFFVIPYAIIGANYWFKFSLTSTQLLFLTTMSRLNTLVNIVIYVLRQREIRRGMWNILKCGMGTSYSLNGSHDSRPRPQFNNFQDVALVNVPSTDE